MSDEAEQPSSDGGHSSKSKKAHDRRRRRQRFMEALRYHHRPNAAKLEATTVKGGSQTPDEEGLNEELDAKVGAQLQSLRAGLYVGKERARKRARSLSKGRS